MWLGAPIGALIGMTTWSFDPLGISYAASVMLFLGSFVLIQFVDYREKEQSFRLFRSYQLPKVLLRSPASELNKLDYSEALPFLYAFRIKTLVKRKFIRELPAEIYDGDPDRKGALL